MTAAPGKRKPPAVGAVRGSVERYEDAGAKLATKHTGCQQVKPEPPHQADASTPPPLTDDDAPPIPGDDKIDQTAPAAEIKRLSALSPVAYDQTRKAAAKRLGIRVSLLDGLVVEQRRVDSPLVAGQDAPFSEITPCAEVVNAATLLTDIAATIRRFAILPGKAADAVALWIAMTHLVAVLHVLPILLITAATMRAGKTTLLSIIAKLVYRPLPTSNISAAALFRCIEAWTPCLLIDEADSFLRENEELRGVINSGHTRSTAYILRCVGDTHEVKHFSTYCPKVISGIGRQAGTITDRSVVVKMRRKGPDETIERLRDAEPDLFDSLRSKLARFTADHAAEIRAARPDIPSELNDRAADNWYPLLAIAEVAGGGWPKLAMDAAIELSGAVEVNDGAAVELLADIRAIFNERKTDAISSGDLVAALCSDLEKRWATFRNEKALTQKQLAGLLKGFDISSTAVKFNGSTLRSYKTADFEQAFNIYFPAPPVSSATVQPDRENKELDEKDVQPVSQRYATGNSEHPPVADGCATVALEKTGIYPLFQESCTVAHENPPSGKHIVSGAI